MYTTCIFCGASLGSNELIERFPVGRRIAYDERTGRLWVVCRACERWNLSPLESRWEAIEEAERLFRATPLKVSGENIGLAQTREGLELVRVGAPVRAELMAWRYGDQFGRRYRRQMVLGGAVVIIVGGAAGFSIIGASAPLLVAWTTATSAVANLTWGISRVQRGREVPRIFIRGENGEPLLLNGQDARVAALVPEGAADGRLELPHRRQIGEPGKGVIAPAPTKAVLRGEHAFNALSRLMPILNHGGGSARRVSEAIAAIGEARSVKDLLRTAAVNTEAQRTHIKIKPGESNIGALPARLRLALEMTLHEDDERRAMEGELAALEERWKEADVVARIADDLLMPETIDRELEALRDRPAP